MEWGRQGAGNPGLVWASCQDRTTPEFIEFTVLTPTLYLILNKGDTNTVQAGYSVVQTGQAGPADSQLRLEPGGAGTGARGAKGCF